MKNSEFVKRVKEIFPEVQDHEIGDLLLSFTSFPFGSGSDKPAQGHYLNQLRRIKRAADSGKIVCFYCAKIRKPAKEPNGQQSDMCIRCQNEYERVGCLSKMFREDSN